MLAIQKHLNGQYEFRRNEVLDRTEFRLFTENRVATKKQTYKILTERDLNSIQIDLTRNDIKCSMTTLKTLLNSEFVPNSDPFREYFESLPKWHPEKSTDYIRGLAEKVRLSEDDLQTTWYDYFERWLVASVGSAIDPNVTNHQVLVLVGEQGLGKSTFLNKLIPKPLRDYLYTGNVDPNNKDTLVNLAENMFINLDELENLNKTELGNLKALITQSEIKLRRAYAVFNESLRRRASFMGSVNDAEFLTDTTGNRRYLIFTCKYIEYNHKIDMDKVYSQAYYLFKHSKENKSYKYIFDSEDYKKLDKLNFNYLRVSTEEDMLIKHYSPTTREAEDCILLTPTEILREIERIEGAIFDKYSSIRKLGQALHKHKFTKLSKNNRKPYILKRNDLTQTKFDENDSENISDIATSGRLSAELMRPFKYEIINDAEKNDSIGYYEIVKRNYNRNIFESYFTYQTLRLVQEHPDIKHTEDDIHWFAKNLMYVMDNFYNYNLEEWEIIIQNIHNEFIRGKY
jgi:hypothetical protein